MLILCTHMAHSFLFQIQYMFKKTAVSSQLRSAKSPVDIYWKPVIILYMYHRMVINVFLVKIGSPTLGVDHVLAIVAQSKYIVYHICML